MTTFDVTRDCDITNLRIPRLCSIDKGQQSTTHLTPFCLVNYPVRQLRLQSGPPSNSTDRLLMQMLPSSGSIFVWCRWHWHTSITCFRHDIILFQDLHKRHLPNRHVHRVTSLTAHEAFILYIHSVWPDEALIPTTEVLASIIQSFLPLFIFWPFPFAYLQKREEASNCLFLLYSWHYREWQCSWIDIYNASGIYSDQ